MTIADTPARCDVDFFRAAVLQALAAYRCESDYVFQQQFQFAVQ